MWGQAVPKARPNIVLSRKKESVATAAGEILAQAAQKVQLESVLLSHIEFG